MLRPKAAAPTAAAPTAAAPAPAEKRSSRKKSGILGRVDLDESKPLGEQLRAALAKNAVRVMDLFREWEYVAYTS